MKGHPVILMFLLASYHLKVNAQNCLDSLHFNQVLILKNMKKQLLVYHSDSLKSFKAVNHKNLKLTPEYLNTFSDKSLCLWNRKKLVRNKRAIIATSVFAGIFLIPSLAVIKTFNEPENLSGFLTEMSLAPFTATFAFSAIGLGIKRHMILKKSKTQKLNCTF